MEHARRVVSGIRGAAYFTVLKVTDSAACQADAYVFAQLLFQAGGLSYCCALLNGYDIDIKLHWCSYQRVNLCTRSQRPAHCSGLVSM